MDANRAFEFIELPIEPPATEPLVGHDRFAPNCYHGTLHLELTALTPVFIAAGITALGSDVGESVPLLKVMVQDSSGNPILQGTSLKGCLRAIYETITNSTFGVEKKVGRDQSTSTATEQRIRERRPNQAKRSRSLAAAELVFGAMGLQGLISIYDAVGDRPLELGHLPPMFLPKAGRGRKFYRHHSPALSPAQSSAQPATDPEKPPSPIQQAPVGTVFTTTLRFSNLTLAQLGALLIALGQDPNYRFALKVGAGKGKGFGSLAVNVRHHARVKSEALHQARYLTYRPDDPSPSDQDLAAAIAAAHASGLIHTEQLQRLQTLLDYPEGER